MELTGVIKKILPVQEGTSAAGKDWKKTGFVVTYKDGEYDNDAAFTVFGVEKTDNFLKYNKVGDTVTAKFNVKSREYNDRWYTDLDAWRVEKVENGVDAEGDQLPF